MGLVLMGIKIFLLKWYALFSSQLGFDPLMFWRALLGFPIYIVDWFYFRKCYSGKMRFTPCLHDRREEGGATKSEYFWQDLLVARAIYEDNPSKHVDIGSRIDGFVAHVASFREIEVIDIRPITANIPGVVFRRADLMEDFALSAVTDNGYCDSLSCLHALEHFGLGRYGDPINPDGYKLGIANMAKLIRGGGKFYLSTPVGQERVEFNANWVFNPTTIIQCASESGCVLEELILVNQEGAVAKSHFDTESLATIAAGRYCLAIFYFRKLP